jgi:hypothetical protein
MPMNFPPQDARSFELQARCDLNRIHTTVTRAFRTHDSKSVNRLRNPKFLDPKKEWKRSSNGDTSMCDHINCKLSNISDHWNA